MQRIFRPEFLGVDQNALNFRLFFEGWNCGEEWAIKNYGSDNISPHPQKDNAQPQP
jgi:hypothetical protein